MRWREDDLWKIRIHIALGNGQLLARSTRTLVGSGEFGRQGSGKSNALFVKSCGGVALDMEGQELIDKGDSLYGVVGTDPSMTVIPHHMQEVKGNQAKLTLYIFSKRGWVW